MIFKFAAKCPRCGLEFLGDSRHQGREFKPGFCIACYLASGNTELIMVVAHPEVPPEPLSPEEYWRFLECEEWHARFVALWPERNSNRTEPKQDSQLALLF